MGLFQQCSYWQPDDKSGTVSCSCVCRKQFNKRYERVPRVYESCWCCESLQGLCRFLLLAKSRQRWYGAKMLMIVSLGRRVSSDDSIEWDLPRWRLSLPGSHRILTAENPSGTMIPCHNNTFNVICVLGDWRFSPASCCKHSAPHLTVDNIYPRYRKLWSRSDVAKRQSRAKTNHIEARKSRAKTNHTEARKSSAIKSGDPGSLWWRSLCCLEFAPFLQAQPLSIYELWR